jgi:tetratricopeptide (TPR) repeat protein
MKRILIIIFTACCVWLPSWADEVDQLYAQAIQHEQARVQSANYRSALKSYETALGYIDQLLSQFPDSDIARSLLAGESKISGCSLNEYRALEDSMQFLARAEQDSFACAIAVAQTMDRLECNGALSSMVGMYARNGQYAAALEVVEAIEKEPTTKDWALDNIVKKCAEARHFDKAHEIASTIQDREIRGFAFQDIAYAFEDAGLFREALATAKRIEDQSIRADVLGRIHIPQNQGSEVETGQILADALSAAHDIKDKADKIGALSIIAGRYAELGDHEKSIQLFSEALAITKTIEDPFGQMEALSTIAEDCITVGQQEFAAQVVAQQIKLLEATAPNQDYKDLMLADIADQYAEAGMYQQAFDIVATIRHQPFRDEMYTEVIKRSAEAGHTDQALEMVKNITDDRIKFEIIAFIANDCTEPGEEEPPEPSLPQMLEEAMAVTDVSDRVDTMIAVAGRYTDAGQNEQAVQILSDALEWVKTMDQDWERTSALDDIAVQYAATGKFDLAMKTANQMNDRSFRDETLVGIAEKCAEARRFIEALEVTREILYPRRQGYALCSISIQYAAAEKKPGPEEIEILSAIVQKRYPQMKRR